MTDWDDSTVPDLGARAANSVLLRLVANAHPCWTLVLGEVRSDVLRRVVTLLSASVVFENERFTEKLLGWVAGYTFRRLELADEAFARLDDLGEFDSVSASFWHDRTLVTEWRYERRKRKGT